MPELEHQLTLAAERTVHAPREEIFDCLSDLDRHWQLGGRFVRVVELDGPAGARDGGVVRLRGPLGLSRKVRTRVLESARPSRMTGRAEIGAATAATVSWTLTPIAESETHVELRAGVLRAALLDRALLTLGGRWWLRRMFESTLAALADRCEATRAALAPAAQPRRGDG
jgi:uncharacterized protein YndB with AHSA1/START domain